MDPRVFYPEDGQQVSVFKQAIAICDRCPCAEPCREMAVAREEPFGVWGGLTPRQRRGLITVRSWRTSMRPLWLKSA